MVGRLTILHADRGREVDGIRDHSRLLAAELARQELEVDLRSPRNGSGGGALAWGRALAGLRGSGRDSAIVLQYMPFCFAGWGFAPWLPLYLLLLRVGRERPTIALMVHEPYVPMINWRWVLMGIWQRFQLAALRLAADVVFTSIDPWAKRFARQLPRRPVHHLPVGSNFPDRRAERGAARAEIGVEAGTLVIATLGRDHPSWRREYALAGLNAIAAGGEPIVWLNLGAEAPELPGLDPAIAVHRSGYLEDAALARRLAAADLFLAPLLDGVSTRRGTLMAALQHGLPIVGTVGPLTDPLLRDAGPGLTLTPVRDPNSFAAAATRLAAEPAARRAAGEAARGIYERHFAWPVIAAELIAAIPAR